MGFCLSVATGLVLRRRAARGEASKSLTQMQADER